MIKEGVGLLISRRQTVAVCRVEAELCGNGMWAHWPVGPMHVALQMD
jgi:hypothetical protein